MLSGAMKSSRDIVARSGDIFHQMEPGDTEIMFPRVFVVMGEWIQWKENDRLCQNITNHSTQIKGLVF